MALTKNTKPRAQYQQWVTGDISDGDILDLFGSLGRGAHQVVIESIGGATTIRLNVAKKVYKEHGALHNEWLAQGQGSVKSSPLAVDEVELLNPDIVLTSDSITTFTNAEQVLNDIKIVQKSSGLKITVT